MDEENRTDTEPIGWLRRVLYLAGIFVLLLLAVISLNANIPGFGPLPSALLLGGGTVLLVGIPSALWARRVRGAQDGLRVLAAFLLAAGLFVLSQYLHPLFSQGPAASSPGAVTQTQPADSGSGSIVPQSAQGDIPKSLLQLAQRYPETQDFVSAYPAEHGQEHEIDLSAELTPGKIPLFLQWDRRWGYETYGSDFMAVTGCGPTALSMVLCGLLQDPSKDPLSIARYAQEKGYYEKGVGSSWKLMTEGATEQGLQCEAGALSAEYLKENLSPATPMIASVTKGDFTLDGHFIVLTGLNADGTVIVNDPNSRQNSERGWSIDRLLPQIRALWKYWK